MFGNVLGQSQENEPLADKNDKTERAREHGRQKQVGDRKGESDDSPEIPGRGVHQTSPASLSGHPRCIIV